MTGNWRTAMIRGELLVRVKAIVESNAAKSQGVTNISQFIDLAIRDKIKEFKIASLSHVSTYEDHVKILDLMLASVEGSWQWILTMTDPHTVTIVKRLTASMCSLPGRYQRRVTYCMATALPRLPQSHRIVSSGMLALATLPTACPVGGRCGKRPAGCLR